MACSGPVPFGSSISVIMHAQINILAFHLFPPGVHVRNLLPAVPDLAAFALRHCWSVCLSDQKFDNLFGVFPPE